MENPSLVVVQVEKSHSLEVADQAQYNRVGKELGFQKSKDYLVKLAIRASLYEYTRYQWADAF
jgi:hypothetical protein